MLPLWHFSYLSDSEREMAINTLLRQHIDHLVDCTRQAVVRQELAQAELAWMVDVHEVTIAHWEDRITMPRIHNSSIGRLGRVLGADVPSECSNASQ